MLDTSVSVWNYTYSNDTLTDTIAIPTTYEALDGTTYIYRDRDIPQRAMEYSCGPRCLWMWAHVSRGPSFGNSRPIFYQCPITVFPVVSATNAILPEHNVTDDMARLLAASIGLQGRKGLVNGWQGWKQYQLYTEGTAWELHNLHRADDAGANMAEFAIASLSTLALQNARVTVAGAQPNLASYLNFSWGRVAPLLGTIVLLHGALYAATQLVKSTGSAQPGILSQENILLSDQNAGANNADSEESPSEPPDVLDQVQRHAQIC